jgi:glycosyltransferase involved in cell wall biosynthesis
MKRVLLVSCYERSGGAELVCKHTKDLLIKCGRYEVEAFTGAPTHERPKGPQDYIWSFRFARQMRRKLEEFRPNVIHIHGFYHLLSPSVLWEIHLYKKHNSVSVFYTAHDYHLVSPNSGMLSYTPENKPVMLSQHLTVRDLFFKRLDHRGWRFSVAKKAQWFLAYRMFQLMRVFDKVFCPSAFMKATVDANIDNVDTVIVRNPINFCQHSMVQANASLADSEAIRLIFLGRLSREKGILELLSALAGIKSTNFVFHIFGEGDEFENIRRRIDSLELGDKVQLMGFLSNAEARERLAGYDILVLPSLWYENSPLSLVEGALSGLRLITMGYGGMQETAMICGNYELLRADFSNLEEVLAAAKNKGFVNNIQHILDTYSSSKYLATIEQHYAESC